MVDRTLKPKNVTSPSGGTRSRPKIPLKSKTPARWRVEQILKHTEEPGGKKLNYLIKWKNQPTSSNTWENADVFWRDNASKRIQDSYLSKVMTKKK
jgi:hypothetical protein